jgi:hypothetical protein
MTIDRWHDSAMNLANDPPEPRSVLGLPVRLVLAIGSIALPLLAVAWFSATHEWPSPESCAFAVLWCPSASPLGVRAVDWLNLAGPLLGLVSAAGAFGLPIEPREAGMLVARYAVPVVGLFVAIGCAMRLVLWLVG